MAPTHDAEWEREALRLCDRYVREVVLDFGLCPWAEPVLRTGRVGRAVCLSPEPTSTECLPFFDRFAAASAPPVDIGLLVFPRHTGGWASFDAFAERVRRADRQRWASPATSVFLVAAFHPDGVETFTAAHQMVSFLRRTPDPMLQLVRAEIIDRLKENQPTVSDDVARRNYDALGARAAGAVPRDAPGGAGRLDPPGGASRLDAVVRAIRADRDTTYARLGAGLGGLI